MDCRTLNCLDLVNLGLVTFVITFEVVKDILIIAFKGNFNFIKDNLIITFKGFTTIKDNLIIASVDYIVVKDSLIIASMGNFDFFIVILTASLEDIFNLINLVNYYSG